MRVFCLVCCLAIWAVTLFFDSCPAFSQPPEREGAADVLCFSMIPKKNIDQQVRELTPLFELLEEKLHKPVRIIRPHSYHSVIEGVLSETIDVAVLGPASYASARARDARVTAFASFARKKGFLTPRGSHYYSVLFALKKSGIGPGDDLGQKTIALTDPESTSGAVIPDMVFSKRFGRPLEDCFGTVLFTGSHDRSIASVRQGRVDAAFVSSVRIDEAVEKKQLHPDQVAILWQSEPIHHDPFVFSGGVGETLRDQIRQVMFSQSPSLKMMLRNMHMAGIVAVSDRDYQQIHEIVARQQAR